MAIQTRTVSNGTDPSNGSAWDVGYTYDDTDMMIRTVFCHNPTTRPVNISVTGKSNSRNYTRSVPANTDVVSINISTNAANRLQLSITPSGKLDGVEINDISWGLV